MNIWHDGPPDPAYLPLSNPLAPPPTAPRGSTAAARPARVHPTAARVPRTLPALIKQIVAAPTEDDARRVTCTGLRALLRCRGVALRLLDDVAAFPASTTPRAPDAGGTVDAADDAITAVPVLADQQVIGSLILDRGSTPRALSSAGRATAEAVAQVLAQRLAHLRLLGGAAPAAVQSTAPDVPAAGSPWLAAIWQARHDQFLDAVAHALRTPLTGVSGYTQLLRRELDRADAATAGDPAAHARARGQLAALMRQATRMNLLLRDMLDAARIAGHQPLEQVNTVDLGALVLAVAESVRAASPHHLIISRAPRALTVFGDGADITRIVRHLLENAVNFSPVGGPIVLTLRREQRADGTVVGVLRVRDHGIGIPAGMEDAIFASPAQRDLAGTRHLAGIGLGLRVSRALAARHGGTLRAVPGRSVGAMFELCLPVADTAEGAAAPSLPTVP